MKHLTLSILFSAACVSAAVPAPSSRFDGSRAYEHLRQLVTFGPRPAGSAALQQTRAYITKQLSAVGLAVQEQPFDATTPLGTIKMVNLRATVPGGQGPRLVVAGHYDTKLFREFPFVGANDGGSSAAFLIELARVLKQRRNAVPIELLFLDGEEAVIDWQTNNDHTYGSRHYVEAGTRDRTLNSLGALVLVDMIGDRDLHILRESNSTSWLTDVIWKTANKLNRPEFSDRATPIEDDHLEFLSAGVPAVDLIDLDYPAWHTREDTLDKVAAGSLQAVGDVLVAALPELERHLIGANRR